MLRNPLGRRRKALGVLGLATAATVAAIALPAPGAGAGVLSSGTITANGNTFNSGSVPTLNVTHGDTVAVAASASSGTTVTQIQARLCNPGVTPASPADLTPTIAGNCAAAPLAPGTNNAVTQPAAPPYSSVSLNFVVGTGTTTFNLQGGGTGTVTCDSTHPCDLWVLYSNSTSDPVQWANFHLNFAAATNPAQVTAPSGTEGNGKVDLSWSAPAAAGNSWIDSYRITATPSGGGSPTQVSTTPVTCPLASTCSVTAPTSFSVTGLTNFLDYTFTVEARNQQGLYGSPSPASATLTPRPPAPAAPTATAGYQSADVSWLAPVAAAGDPPATQNLTGYRVTPYTGASFTTPGTPTDVGIVLQTTVTGLANGNDYRFTVRGIYTINATVYYGPESAQSGTAQPFSTTVTQTIQAERPEGTLEIAEACANGTGVVPGTPADGPRFGVYPQSCLVTLGAAQINGAGTYYLAQGALEAVSVRNLKSTDAGWNTNAVINDFNDGAGHTFTGGCLAFDPTATPGGAPAGVPGGYAQSITAATGSVNVGSVTNGVGSDCTGAGLTSSTTVMSAAAGGSLGRADLTGALALNIPVNAAPGTYQATLTFTAI